MRSSNQKDSKKMVLEISASLSRKTIDKTYGKGRIGIGSFDDMNDFDDIKLRGR